MRVKPICVAQISSVVPKYGAMRRGPETSSPSETTPPTKTSTSSGSGAAASPENHLPRGCALPSHDGTAAGAALWGATPSTSPVGTWASVCVTCCSLSESEGFGSFTSMYVQLLPCVASLRGAVVRQERETVEHRLEIARHAAGELVLGGIECDDVRMVVVEGRIDLHADQDQRRRWRGRRICAPVAAVRLDADERGTAGPCHAAERHRSVRVAQSLIGAARHIREGAERVVNPNGSITRIVPCVRSGPAPRQLHLHAVVLLGRAVDTVNPWIAG